MLEKSMAIIVDGRKLASAIIKNLKPRVRSIKKQGGKVTLAAVLVGDNKASQTYIRKKKESAQSIGVDFFKFVFPANISQSVLEQKIKNIQKQRNFSGLIIQLPLPDKLKPFTQSILNQVEPSIDVDCLTEFSQNQIKSGRAKMFPPTPAAIMEILKYHHINLKGKQVLIIGRGRLVGLPLSMMLKRQIGKLVVVGSECHCLDPLTQKADIIICGAGKKKLVRGEMVKNRVVVIDAGVSFEKKKMFGDVEFKSVGPKAGLITPVPGGVGPVTVAKLLENTVKSAENIYFKKKIIRSHKVIKIKGA